MEQVATPVDLAEQGRHVMPTRLLSLDVFRGLTIAGMLLVNDPGSWDAIYRPFAHAEWNGWTPADLIFPFFLFIVGITTHLSLTTRRARGADDTTLLRQILRRGGVIVLLGLAFSAFPYFPLTRITHMRIPGVLQRIGVAYICSALLTFHTTVKQQVAIIVAILFGYWFALTLIPVPGHGLGALTLTIPSATLAAWVDRLLLDGHLWIQSVTWDPEGVFSTIPAIATTMLGALTGRWLFSESPMPGSQTADGSRMALAERCEAVAPTEPPSTHQPRSAHPDPALTLLATRLNALFTLGALGMMLGLMWNWSFPINKNLWTSSYVVFTAGTTCVTLAACIWIIDIQKITWWTRPFVIFGTNPIVAFVGSEVVARSIYSLINVPLHGKSVPLQTAIYETAFASWLSPKDASLLFAGCMALLWLGILTFLYRKKIFLKV
jgi:predicted acyltransferase